MTRAERRSNTERKSESRRKKILSISHHRFSGEDLEEKQIGYFRNNSIANKYANAGKAKKTNTRKSHSSYRSRLGGYGKAKKYKPHDQRQIDKLSLKDDE